jgi:hypothetical protein
MVISASHARSEMQPQAQLDAAGSAPVRRKKLMTAEKSTFSLERAQKLEGGSGLSERLDKSQ